MKVSLIDQHLETDLYCKRTVCHQSLDFNYAHPKHIKKSIVYSQGLRIKRLCSSNVAFENHLESLKGCNLGQKVGDKLTKLSKIGFSMECFTADFLPKSVKIWL